MNRSLSVVVLAAGRSTRMEATNKLLLPFAGKTVLQTVLATLFQLRWHEVLVVLGHDSLKLKKHLATSEARFVDNADYGSGMASSIKCGVAATDPQSAGFIFVLGDMPLVTLATYEQLCGCFPEQGAQHIVVPVMEGIRGNPVIFGQSYRSELMELKGDRGARSLAGKYPNLVIEVPVADPGVIFEVDTPEDYQTILGE